MEKFLKNLQKILFFLLILLLPTQLGGHFWPEWSYVLGLKIDYLSPTIYLTDLLVIGILGLWFLEKLKTPPRWRGPAQTSPSEKECWRGRHLGGGKWLVIAIFLYLLINSLLAQNPGAALYKFVKIIEFFLLGLYVAKNIQISQYPSILISLSLAVIYSSLIAIFQFLKQSSLNGIFWWLGERTFNAGTPGIAEAIVGGRLFMRPYATFPHPNALAGVVLVGLIVIANFSARGGPAFGWSSRKRRSRIVPSWIPDRSGIGVRWLALVLGIITILISFSRSTWLVGLLVGLWVLSRRKSLLVLGVLFATLLLISARGGSALGGKLPFSTEEAISQRLQLIKVTTLMIQSAPLTGAGLNNFIVRLPEFWQAPETIRFLQPVHNIFLLVAAETGLVGLVIFLWFLILTFKHLGWWPEGTPPRWNYLALALSAILALGLFDHYFLTLQQTQLLFSIVLGLVWSYNERKLRKEIKYESIFCQTWGGDGRYQKQLWRLGR